VEKKGIHRKLTHILSADVAEYRRLMQGDEAATAKIPEVHKQIISESVKSLFYVPLISEWLPQQLFYLHKANLRTSITVREDRDIAA